MKDYLWNKDAEKDFFLEYLKKYPPEDLFYKLDKNKYVAYWPKSYKGRKSTLQSRNALIGEYTEKWVENLFKRLNFNRKLFVVRKVICEEIGLNARSPADLALCLSNYKVQKPEDILLIIEIKMSLVWNWEFDRFSNNLQEIGDFTTHVGTPGLLRSDSMLKAIGKSVNIRIASEKSSSIPIIILGNTPIQKTYYSKVDPLRKTGIIQKFYSVNPEPLNKKNEDLNIKETRRGGFFRIDCLKELETDINKYLASKRIFFSGMKTFEELGKLIFLANKGSSFREKATIFLKYLEREIE